MNMSQDRLRNEWKKLGVRSFRHVIFPNNCLRHWQIDDLKNKGSLQLKFDTNSEIIKKKDPKIHNVQRKRNKLRCVHDGGNRFLPNAPTVPAVYKGLRPWQQPPTESFPSLKMPKSIVGNTPPLHVLEVSIQQWSRPEVIGGAPGWGCMWWSCRRRVSNKKTRNISPGSHKS